MKRNWTEMKWDWNELNWVEFNWTELKWNEWMNEWMNDTLKERSNEWMSELLHCCVSSRLNHIFAEVPVLLAISSLGSLLSGAYFFSDPLLLLAASPFSYPATPSAYSFCNPSLLFVQLWQCVCNLQSRIAQEWHHAQKLHFLQLLQVFWQPPAAIPHSRRVAASLVLSPALCRANVFRDRSVTPNRPTRAALKWGRLLLWL